MGRPPSASTIYKDGRDKDGREAGVCVSCDDDGVLVLEIRQRLNSISSDICIILTYDDCKFLALDFNKAADESKAIINER